MASRNSSTEEERERKGRPDGRSQPDIGFGVRVLVGSRCRETYSTVFYVCMLYLNDFVVPTLIAAMMEVNEK